jgi:hypothetical protein
MRLMIIKLIAISTEKYSISFSSHTILWYQGKPDIGKNVIPEAVLRAGKNNFQETTERRGGRFEWGCFDVTTEEQPDRSWKTPGNIKTPNR